MPQAVDLMGMGVPPNLAAATGNTPLAVTAAGTTQATAAPAKSGSHMFEMTATGSDGIILPVTLIGTPVYVYNSSGSTGLVYVPVGHTLNSTLNGNLSLATHKAAIFIQYKNAFWSSNLTA